MSRSLQEGGCLHSQAVQESYFQASDQAHSLFLQYQASTAGIPINHPTVLLCNSSDNNSLRIGVDTTITLSPNQHDNYHTRRQAISLCGHGVNGRKCPAFVSRPTAHHDHLGDPEERH